MEKVQDPTCAFDDSAFKNAYYTRSFSVISRFGKRQMCEMEIGPIIHNTTTTTSTITSATFYIPSI